MVCSRRLSAASCGFLRFCATLGRVHFAQERQTAIVERIEREGRIVSASLAEELALSIDSIRRDLQELEAAGALRRVHGGAVRPLAGQARFLDRLDEPE